ncbi:unnamed protein product [Phytomonas sp. EM1]|nr:unnamed protein product [Phytomonas sp. EM1]|eukprot:CCW63596.1 unnamed protein product [Phytomonas sp. isolate EM1]
MSENFERASEVRVASKKGKQNSKNEEKLTHPLVDENEKPKVIMSRAQRRKLKKSPVVVTAQMREQAREDKRELRKYLRMIKSNGARRKVSRLAEKRRREVDDNEEAINALDFDHRPLKKGRRLE